MLLGASGFIGSAVCARLVASGHRVLAVSRRRFDPGLAAVEHAALDISRATDPDRWQPLLSGVDAVVNCAGILQDGPGESTRGVHVSGVAALFAACARAGVQRVVHVSAIGVGQDRPTPFSRSKQEGEQALMRSGLEWVILRPSVVVGRAAYGGSAFLRALAALPILPVVPRTGPIQIVHLDDLVETVRFFLQPEAPARVVLDVAGPRAWPFTDVVRLLRRWLRLPKAPEVNVPEWIAAALYRIGDAVGLLGWRAPMRTTARLEVRLGAVGDPGQWRRITGIVPRDIADALLAEPASVQERWFARLYLLKPLVLGVLVLFWVVTGLIAIGPGWRHGLALLGNAGLGGPVATLTVVAGALVDIAIGLLIAYRPTARHALYASIGLSIAYVVIGTILVPSLWTDPLGPLLKVAPILILNLVALAILEDR